VRLPAWPADRRFDQMWHEVLRQTTGHCRQGPHGSSVHLRPAGRSRRLASGLRGRQGREKKEGQAEGEKRGVHGAHGRRLQRDRSPLGIHFPGATLSDLTWKLTRCVPVRHAVTGQRLARAPCVLWSSGAMAIRLHDHGASNSRFPRIKNRSWSPSLADRDWQAGVGRSSRRRCPSSPCPSSRP